METFVLAQTNEGTGFSQEMGIAVVGVHPYLTHIAPLCVFNRTGSGKYIHVKKIEINNLSISTSATLVNAITLNKITAITGGTAVTPIKVDSVNASLPSQVSIISEPASVTGTVVYRNRNSTARRNLLRVLGNMTADIAMDGTLSLGLMYGWNKDATTAETQKLTLREGDGVAVVRSASMVPYEATVSIWLRNQSTGACYIASTVLFLQNKPILAVLNGAGSGVILEVIRVEIGENGEDYIPQFSIEYVDEANIESHGEALTPISLDSTNSLSGSVNCYKNARIQTVGAKKSAYIVIPYQRRISVGAYGTGVAKTDMIISIKSNCIYCQSDKDYGIKLREGEGIAIMQRNTGKLYKLEFIITFCQETPAGGTTSAEISSVF